MEDNIVRYTLFVLVSVVGMSEGRNEIVVFAFAFVLVFYCLYAARRECALSFSFAFSFLAFNCVWRLRAMPLLIGSNIILS